ncbi:MAG: hypothetical protein AB2693_08520, partial [Candidatus Thiodiazotropha sp.]
FLEDVISEISNENRNVSSHTLRAGNRAMWVFLHLLITGAIYSLTQVQELTFSTTSFSPRLNSKSVTIHLQSL